MPQSLVITKMLIVIMVLSMLVSLSEMSSHGTLYPLRALDSESFSVSTTTFKPYFMGLNETLQKFDIEGQNHAIHVKTPHLMMLKSKSVANSEELEPEPTKEITIDEEPILPSGISESPNTTLSSSLPSELSRMSTNSRNCVIAYCILFVISASGNMTVFFTVLRQIKKLKWRITMLILNLSIADLFVTFFVMPLEIIWRVTLSWNGGNILCKICQFFRAFGFYLSSNIIICISLDRWMAILFPLRFGGFTTKRVKVMLTIAWISAGIFSLPQSIVFSVQQHPKHPTFLQCVSYGSKQELINTVVSLVFMYFLPLLVILFTYSMILWKINQKAKEHSTSSELRGENQICCHEGRSRCCRLKGCTNSESAALLARAKRRTLRLTVIIVAVFLCTWTPYGIITLWYMIDRESAEKLDHRLQDALFIMAVANSCVNPIVYGSYSRKNNNGSQPPTVPQQKNCQKRYAQLNATDPLPVTAII